MSHPTQASRDKAQTQSFASRGVRVTTTGFTDVLALTSALAGAHVVISTISLMAIDAQVPIAQAAKAAGASLFVPSEFGGSTDRLQGLLGTKGALHAKLREVGPPLLLVYTGPFADYSWGQYVPLFPLRCGSKDDRGLMTMTMTG
jgi:uncharacterized protein YbjT (DUF2867 family)